MAGVSLPSTNKITSGLLSSRVELRQKVCKCDLGKKNLSRIFHARFGHKNIIGCNEARSIKDERKNEIVRGVSSRSSSTSFCEDKHFQRKRTPQHIQSGVKCLIFLFATFDNFIFDITTIYKAEKLLILQINLI